MLAATVGTAVAMLGSKINVQLGGAQYMLARESIHVDQGAAALMVSPRVEMQSGFVGVLFAREFHGNVRTLFDQRGAVIFGVAAGIVMGLIAQSRRK